MSFTPGIRAGNGRPGSTESRRRQHLWLPLLRLRPGRAGTRGPPRPARAAWPRSRASPPGPWGNRIVRRTWAEFGPLPADRALDTALASATVAADGGCLDAQGALWIADAIGGRLIRVREGGEITDELHPDSPVYACALGGADGRTLYACAASDFDEKARTAAQEATLIAYRVHVPAA